MILQLFPWELCIIKRITVVVSPEIHKELKMVAINTDTTLNNVIVDAIKKYLQLSVETKYHK